MTPEWLIGDSEEGGPGLAYQFSSPRATDGLPHRALVWLQKELLDYAMAGATEAEMGAARRLLTAPELVAFYRGSASTAEDDMLRAMQGVAGAMRAELRRRGRKLEKTPRPTVAVSARG